MSSPSSNVHPTHIMRGRQSPTGKAPRDVTSTGGGPGTQHRRSNPSAKQKREREQSHPGIIFALANPIIQPKLKLRCDAALALELVHVTGCTR